MPAAVKSRQQQRHNHTRQGYRRTDGEVDQPGNDDHGHAKGDHAFQGIAAQDVHPVRPGHETLGAKGQANDQDDQNDLNDMIEQKDPNLFAIKSRFAGSGSAPCSINLLSYKFRKVH